jgi:hypothetical protein
MLPGMGRLSYDFRRCLCIWLGLSAIATPLAAIVLGPRVGPGDQADARAVHAADVTVSTVIATPILLLIVTFLTYDLIVFREKGRAIADRSRRYAHRHVHMTWIAGWAGTAAGLFAFATWRVLALGA